MTMPRGGTPDWPLIDGALEIVRQALEAGHIGYAGLMSSHQSDSVAILEQLHVWICQNRAASAVAVLEKLTALHANHRGRESIRAVNTTAPHQLEG
mgnify:CR=1 FL=1